jgi:hypothetical protein
MQVATKLSILRLAIILTVVALVTVITASGLFEETLPPELAQFVKAKNSRVLTNLEAVAMFVNSLIIVALLVGAIGLWWVKRWARVLFTIAAILFPPMWTFVGFASGATLVSNPVEMGVDTALNIFIGATIALVWVGIPEAFELDGRAA